MTGDDNNDNNGADAFIDDTDSLSYGIFSVSENDSGKFHGIVAEACGMGSVTETSD